MVTVDTDDEMRITPNLLDGVEDTGGNCGGGGQAQQTTQAIKLPPKRLKLLKRYARTNLEEERVPHGRGSSGFAAEQMTIDSEYGDSVDLRSSPPLPDSPTFKNKKEVTCIVIQQPSVCANSPEPESGDEQEIDLEQKREENMRLLEVATTLTVDQLQEFDMKYGSPHHSRSQSVRPRARPNFLSLPQARTRVASMPNTGVEETFYRLRHFSITGKVVVNKGDSLKARRPKSKESVASSPPSGQQTCPSSRQSSSILSCSSNGSAVASSFKVVMLGASAVGKSSLISQFMTSEYLHSYDNSIDDEFGDKSVSVLLDGEESELVFVDHPSQQMSPATCLENYKNCTHAYCVVYSTSDRNSYKVAESLLQNLWTNDKIKSKAVILVANKTDLVRSRVVTNQEYIIMKAYLIVCLTLDNGATTHGLNGATTHQQTKADPSKGKHLATNYDCKYIETSVGFNHNVDELLVGLLSQIRLKQEQKNRPMSEDRRKSTASPPPCLRHFPKTRNARTSASLKVKGLLSKVWARDSKSKSCENLHVL